MKPTHFRPLALLGGLLLIIAVNGWSYEAAHHPKGAEHCQTVISFHNAAPHDVQVHLDHHPPVLVHAGAIHPFHVSAGSHEVHVEHGHDHWLRPVAVAACATLHLEFTPLGWARHHHHG